jgi:hypothetical protein
VVPTISFRLLYGFLVLSHGRRRNLWLGVTAHPTAEWVAQQVTEHVAGCVYRKLDPDILVMQSAQNWT